MRPFSVADWLCECPPDYETVVGWFARNEPEVLKDLYEQAQGNPWGVFKLLSPERQKAFNGYLTDVVTVYDKDDIAHIAYPVAYLDEVLSKDTHVPLDKP